MVGDHVR